MNYTKYFLFVGYVVLSVLVGREFYPFSRFPMYDRFPNWSYVFYLQNERGETVYYKKCFSIDKTAGNAAHNFYIHCNSKNYPYGFGNEDPAHMREAGQKMLTMLTKGEALQQLGFDSLQLYRRYYYLENNQLKHRDDLMYAERIK